MLYILKVYLSSYWYINRKFRAFIHKSTSYEKSTYNFSSTLQEELIKTMFMYLGLLINDWRHLSIDLLCHYILDRILYYCLHNLSFIRMHLMIAFSYQTLADTIITGGIQKKKQIERLFHVASCNVTRYL